MCRREGIKLFLKGERCYTDKCAIERRSYPPGQHGQGRGKKATEYSVQLREKQKLRRIYGMFEAPFRRFFGLAERQKGITGENLVTLLERRLDNMVYRMGFATSRAEARQLVRHGHFLVNQRRVTIPSYLVGSGDEVQVKEASRKISRIQESEDLTQRRGVPEWLEVNKDTFTGRVRALPTRAQLNLPVNEQLIVELYSKV
jgi:small subunit ribosomal protein S4